MTVDPFLRLLQKTLPNSTNRAFADEIATILQSLQDLSTLKTNFDLFRDIFSGLDLKIKKCSLSPLGIDLAPPIGPNESRKPSNKSSHNGLNSPSFPLPNTSAS